MPCIRTYDHMTCDLREQRFGRLIAVEPVKRRGKRVWRCRCDCGGETFVPAGTLNMGKHRSCGCLRSEQGRRLGQRSKHGHCNSPTWNSWRNMRRRCYEPTFRNYKYWGGRGIKVCDRWKLFENFLADMGERPEGHTLDRWPDKDGDYTPTNCRWATPAEQATNRRQKLRRS